MAAIAYKENLNTPYKCITAQGIALGCFTFYFSRFLASKVRNSLATLNANRSPQRQ